MLTRRWVRHLPLSQCSVTARHTQWWTSRPLAVSASYGNDGILWGRKKVNKISKTNDTKNDKATLKTNKGPKTHNWVSKYKMVLIISCRAFSSGTKIPRTNENWKCEEAHITKVAVISKLSSKLEHGLCQQCLCLGVTWPFLLATDFRHGVDHAEFGSGSCRQRNKRLSK